MAKLRHIAISCRDPWATAEFYIEAFGMTKVGETHSTLADGVYLSDGVVNMALLRYKNDDMAGPRAKTMKACTIWAFGWMTSNMPNTE